MKVRGDFHDNKCSKMWWKYRSSYYLIKIQMGLQMQLSSPKLRSSSNDKFVSLCPRINKKLEFG